MLTSHAHQRFLIHFACGLAIVLFALRSVAQDRRPVDAPPLSRVLGRVVDAEAKPLAGVRISMHSVDGPWADGVEEREFEAHTKSDGSFVLEARTPTCDWVSLFVKPDAFHDVAGRNFGPAGGRDQPRLVAGDNDLGLFTLAATGAISGRVLDAAGKPVAKAEVRLAGKFPGGYGRGGATNDDGAFEVGHVPPGEYALEVLARGYLLAKTAKLSVTLRESARVADITLVAGPTISGVVVDELGAVIPDAHVWGWPSGSGSASGARTDEQGRFVVPLKHAVAHRFEVQAAGYSKLEEGHTVQHAAGAADVRLVLKRPFLTTFVVLDERTSAPVTSFAVRLNWKPSDRGSLSGGEPTHSLAEHVGGEFTCAANPDVHVYRITSPGYAPAEGEIVFESPGASRCIVRLRPEGAVRGRVLLAGQPLARAEIKLYAGSLLRDDEEDGSTAPFDEQNYFWSDWEGQQDLVFVLPQPSKHLTEPDGTFALTGLAQGKYRIEINGPSGARISLDPVAVFEGAPLDLRDIDLIPSATLVGHVLLPEGIDPESITLHCYSWDQRALAEVRADRTFTFEGIAAGKAHVGVDKAVGLVTWGKHPEVELRPGQTSQLTLDLIARASVPTTIEVRVNGVPAEGVSVSLSSATEKLGDRLGDTNAEGLATGSVLALGPTNVHLRSQSGVRLGTFERALDIAVGLTPRATIDVACGAVEVEWPALREDEPLYLVRLGAFPDSDEKRMWPHAMPGFDAPGNDARITGKNRARFAWIPPGEVEWTIAVQTIEGNEVKSNHNFRRKFVVRAGETTEVLLTERDRVTDAR